MRVQLHLGTVAAHHATLLALLLQLGGLVVVGVLLGLHLGQRRLQLLLSRLERRLGLARVRLACQRLLLTCDRILLARLGLILSCLGRLRSSNALRLARLRLTQRSRGHLRLGVRILESGVHLVHHRLCLLDLLAVVTLRGVHQLFPVLAIFGNPPMSERYRFHTITDGTVLTQIGTHLANGHGLIERLQQAMGLQFVQMSALLLMININLLSLVDIVPQVFGLLLTDGVPGGIQKPHSLSLEGTLAKVLKFLKVGATRENIQSVIGHFFFFFSFLFSLFFWLLFVLVLC
mmetsp:Transcript_13910/g.41898  ORF Transcript_13910/g.41898 Transcript_13910/m.41898 type:complete len:290 (+) Transcript_13910:562-1431(+)